jgi:hypothetical protein
VHAAPISWGTATTVSDESDVATTGHLLHAEHWGGADATVNGVAFTAAQENVVASPASGSLGINADIGAPASVSAAYRDLLKGNWYTAADGSSVTLHHLQPGNPYLVQIWSSDPRYSPAQVQTITGGPSLGIKTGQWVTGTFTADATTQVIHIGGAGIINAVQVRGIGGVSVGAVDAATSTVSASAASIPPDGTTTATITVALKDANGYRVPGKTVTLASSRGAVDVISPASGPSDASGVVRFTVKSSTSGQVVLTATDVSDGNLVITPTATLSVQEVPLHAPQASPNPIVFNQNATTDNLVVLMAAASEYSEGLSLYYSGPGFYPKHFWISNFNDPYHYLKWNVSLESGAAYRVHAKLSSGAVVPLKLSVEGGAEVLNFSTRNVGWDQLDAGIIQIPAGTSTLALRRDTSATDNVEIVSLELIRESDRPAYEQRVADFRADTTWLSQAKYGLMTQYGAWGYPANGPRKSLEDFANGFDVPAFVSKIKLSGAGYLVWSLTWWEFRMLAPIQAVDDIVGNGARTSSRDLIGELAAALHAEGIRFVLYHHTGHDSHLGYNSTDWWTAQGWPDQEFTARGSGDRSTFFNNWVNVITEIGNRYGDHLDGFFFDDGMVFYPAPFERLGQAAKAGNPDRLVSYNPWIITRNTDFQEVEFGEGSHGEARFGSAPEGGNGIYTDGPHKGLLQHGMFTMEQDWGIKAANEPINTQITPAQAIGWVQDASSRRVPLSFNMMFWEDQSHSLASMNVLTALKAAFPTDPTAPTFGGNLIVNGGFEEPVTNSFVSIPSGSNVLTGWEIAAQPGDGVQLGRRAIFGPDSGSQSLQLTGGSSYQQGGGIRQTIATIPGDTYRVRFDLASRFGNATTGEIAFGSERRPLSTSSPAHLPVTMDFTAKESSTTFGFSGSTDSASRPLIVDNVSVFALQSDFALWQSANFPGQLDQPAISGPLATPAGDAMPNLLKYAFGFQPQVPASGTPVSLVPPGTATTFRYQRPANRPDLVYLVETSLNLTVWNSDGIPQNRVAQSSGMETWETVIPETDPQRRFMRVKVTRH